MKLLFENWRGYINETEAYYHITPFKNLGLILGWDRAGREADWYPDEKTLENRRGEKKGEGLIPKLPMVTLVPPSVEGVYLFRSIDDAEQALLTWLGDKLGEDIKLTLLKIEAAGVGELDTASAAGYEVISKTAIAPEYISIEQESI